MSTLPELWSDTRKRVDLSFCSLLFRRSVQYRGEIKLSNYMNKIANLGIRTLSQTVQPRENQPEDGRKARGDQRRTCKGEKRGGHALERLTTDTVRHARNAAAWCRITFHYDKPWIHWYDLPNWQKMESTVQDWARGTHKTSCLQQRGGFCLLSVRQWNIYSYLNRKNPNLLVW